MNAARLRKQRETAVQSQTSDPEQAKAERDKRIEQLPPELQALVRDRSLRDARTTEGTATGDPAERLRRLEEERRKKLGAIESPNPESSETQPGSPSASPTPQ
jgi:hypothetical protein